MSQSHELELRGCAPEPLMAYLKALGILRLVAEQKDSSARAWWKNDTFMLNSSLDKDALVEFFREEYRPTPIVSPWNGDSGFYQGDNSKALDTIVELESPRFQWLNEVKMISEKVLSQAVDVSEAQDLDEIVKWRKSKKSSDKSKLEKFKSESASSVQDRVP